MNISKTTFNFAKRHGLELTVEDFGDVLQLCIWEADNDCEWLCSYRINYDCLTWHGNIYLPQEVKEELPATINNEVFLRQVLKFISEEIKK